MSYTGLYADDFYPVETFENEVVLGSDIVDTEYLVTGRQNGEYYYVARARDAEDQWSGLSNREEAIVAVPTGVSDEPLIPTKLALDQNYPNPFNPQTSISFTIPEKSDLDLSVYNILGKKVRTLAHGEFEPGDHSVVFDGNNDSGKPVSAGIYFYRLETGNNAFTRKMVLLK